MAATNTARSSNIGAFFDLDKTTIASAALFAFSPALKDAGFISTPDLSSGMGPTDVHVFGRQP